MREWMIYTAETMRRYRALTMEIWQEAIDLERATTARGLFR